MTATLERSPTITSSADWPTCKKIVEISQKFAVQLREDRPTAAFIVAGSSQIPFRDSKMGWDGMPYAPKAIVEISRKFSVRLRKKSAKTLHCCEVFADSFSGQQDGAGRDAVRAEGDDADDRGFPAPRSEHR